MCGTCHRRSIAYVCPLKKKAENEESIEGMCFGESLCASKEHLARVKSLCILQPVWYSEMELLITSVCCNAMHWMYTAQLPYCTAAVRTFVHHVLRTGERSEKELIRSC